MSSIFGVLTIRKFINFTT